MGFLPISALPVLSNTSPLFPISPYPSRASLRLLPLAQEAAAVAVAFFALLSVPVFGCQGISGGLEVAKHVNNETNV